MTDNQAANLYSADFWRSLHYFNLYRLTLACLFIILALLFGSSLSLDGRHWTLFFTTSLLYAGTAVGSLILLKFRRPRFVVQLTLQVFWDIAGLSLLSHASGGIESSIGLLLLVSLAAAGIISRGKITLFFAALATVATLL